MWLIALAEMHLRRSKECICTARIALQEIQPELLKYIRGVRGETFGKDKIKHIFAVSLCHRLLLVNSRNAFGITGGVFILSKFVFRYGQERGKWHQHRQGTFLKELFSVFCGGVEADRENSTAQSCVVYYIYLQPVRGHSLSDESGKEKKEAFNNMPTAAHRQKLYRYQIL